MLQSCHSRALIFRFLPVLPSVGGFKHVGTAATDTQNPPLPSPHFSVTIAQPVCGNTQLNVLWKPEIDKLLAWMIIKSHFLHL